MTNECEHLCSGAICALRRLRGANKGLTGIVIPQLTYLPLSPGRKFAAKTPLFPSSQEYRVGFKSSTASFTPDQKTPLIPQVPVCVHHSHITCKDSESFSPPNSDKPRGPKRLPRCPSRGGGVIENFVVSHITQRENVNGVLTSLTASRMLIHVRSGTQCL